MGKSKLLSPNVMKTFQSENNLKLSQIVKHITDTLPSSIIIQDEMEYFQSISCKIIEYKEFSLNT